MSNADYVVVGAGSAGCAVAARLSEVADARVVVLEAGPADTLEAIHQPPMWPALWGTEVDWAYETVPQPANGGLVHQWPRGKVLGGSSSLNGMVYLRGNRADYDDWAYHGAKGWDYDTLLALFRRMEDVPEGDPHYRGRGGANTPRPAAEPNPICATFVEAARETGHPVTDDHNGAQFEGAGFHDLIITGGRRQSAAGAYLHPASPAEPRGRDRRARARADRRRQSLRRRPVRARRGGSRGARRLRGDRLRRRRRLAGAAPALRDRPGRRAARARHRRRRRRPGASGATSTTTS